MDSILITKQAALFNFFNSFGIPAYPKTAIPDDVQMPYITYDVVVDSFGEDVSLSADIWYKTDSEKMPNKKAQEIADKVTMGGISVPCDGGLIWIKRGSPWCQSVTDTDNTVKRRYLNFDVEYLTI